MAEKLEDQLREQIKIAETNIKGIETDITKARTIGLDTTALQKELDTQKSQIALVKQVYNL